MKLNILSKSNQLRINPHLEEELNNAQLKANTEYYNEVDKERKIHHKKAYSRAFDADPNYLQLKSAWLEDAYAKGCKLINAPPHNYIYIPWRNVESVAEVKREKSEWYMPDQYTAINLTNNTSKVFYGERGVIAVTESKIYIEAMIILFKSYETLKIKFRKLYS